MEFLKRHYEKIILMGLLLLFIFTMIHVLRTVDSTQEITKDDLKIPDLKINYDQQDANQERFRSTEFISKKVPQWKNGVARNVANADHFSDLVHTFQMSECPLCKRIIPRVYFGRKCPECLRDLPKPPDRRYFVRQITAEDYDGDGITNVEEERYSFDADNPDDALYDTDGDGFSNVFELHNNYNVQTDPRNASSHPPMWWRLRFVGMDSTELPIRFTAVNIPDGAEKNMMLWTVRLRTHVRGRRDTSHIKRIGDEIGSYELPGEKKRYMIDGIELAKGTVVKSGDLTAIGAAKLILTEVPSPGATGKPERLVMELGEAVRSNDKRPIFEDCGDWDAEAGKFHTFSRNKNGRIVVGNSRSGRVSYLVESIDPAAGAVTLRFQSRSRTQDPTLDELGNRMVVTSAGMIPEELRFTPGATAVK